MSKAALSEKQIAARGRELSEAKWELPKRFRLNAALLSLPAKELQKKDPEMFALWERTREEQARLAANAAAPHSRPSSQEMFRARSVQRAEELRNTIDLLNQRIGLVLTADGDGNLAELQKARTTLKHRRAEQLAIHGRYDLAFQEEPQPEYREYYLAVLDAIWREDEARCGCSDHFGSGEHANINVPSWNAKKDVWSIKHGRMVTLMKCSKCPFMNAVDTPAHVREMRAHRARAAQLAGKLSISDAANTLAGRGLTSAKLLSKDK